MNEGHLILWGDAAAGKSVLLAAGLTHVKDAGVRIDWKSVHLDTYEAMIGGWERLKLGYEIEQTGAGGMTYTLPLEGGQGRLQVKDMQGKQTDEVKHGREWIEATKNGAVLFVIPWPSATSTRTAKDMSAINHILPEFEKLHKGVVVTMCDRELEADDPHWCGPRGWWAEHKCWQPCKEVLERFGRNVWPTSALGYDTEGRSACHRDESGGAQPCNFQPRNADVPFRWAIQELGLWPKGSP